MTTRMSLERSEIVLIDGQPEYVRRWALELAEYLEEITGHVVSVGNVPGAGDEVQILVGDSGVSREELEGLGAEGYMIRALSDKRLLVTGATPQGVKHGLAALMKLIQIDGSEAYVPSATDIVSRPSFTLRGMHLNGWAFRPPYSFRGWREDEWKLYVDMLACQGGNLLFIWPFMEIMPEPLSAEDASYLDEVRRVVDYAQRQHGMEVWIFQSSNRIGVGDCGSPDPRSRPYWVMGAQGDFATAGQADMNPAAPEQFERLMRSREALYRVVDNANGYCTIDNDPGGWPKSPIEDFMKILKASRSLIDAINVHGRQAKLIYWLWYGWGQPGSCNADWNETRQLDWMRETIRAMRRELPEPWWLIAGQKPYLSACAAEGVSEKTVYLPYNTIEPEPSRPGTIVDFQLICDHVEEIGRFPGTAGLMGNAQTALLQLPNIHYFLSTAWDYGQLRRPMRELLLELAAQMFPERKELLADCWLALRPVGWARAGELADQLERLAAENRLGRLGVLARKIFPAPERLAIDLALQLRAWGAFAELCQVADGPAPETALAKTIEAWLDAALRWDACHGWSDYWRRLGRAWELEPVHCTAYSKLIADLRKAFGRADGVGVFLEPIREKLARRHDSWIVSNCGIKPLAEAIASLKDAV